METQIIICGPSTKKQLQAFVAAPQLHLSCALSFSMKGLFGKGKKGEKVIFINITCSLERTSPVLKLSIVVMFVTIKEMDLAAQDPVAPKGHRERARRSTGSHHKESVCVLASLFDKPMLTFF